MPERRTLLTSVCTADALTLIDGESTPAIAAEQSPRFRIWDQADSYVQEFMK